MGLTRDGSMLVATSNQNPYKLGPGNSYYSPSVWIFHRNAQEVWTESVGVNFTKSLPPTGVMLKDASVEGVSSASLSAIWLVLAGSAAAILVALVVFLIQNRRLTRQANVLNHANSCKERRVKAPARMPTTNEMTHKKSRRTFIKSFSQVVVNPKDIS